MAAIYHRRNNSKTFICLKWSLHTDTWQRRNPFLRTSTTQLVFIWWDSSGPSANCFPATGVVEANFGTVFELKGFATSFNYGNRPNLFWIFREHGIFCAFPFLRTAEKVVRKYPKWGWNLTWKEVTKGGGGGIEESHGNYLRDLMGRLNFHKKNEPLLFRWLGSPKAILRCQKKNPLCDGTFEPLLLIERWMKFICQRRLPSALKCCVFWYWSRKSH